MIRSRLFLPLLMLGVAGCGPSELPTPTISTEPVVLFPDDPGRVGLGALRYTGGLVLASDDARFGGWSAMELNEDGTRMLAISDQGHWMTADITYLNATPSALSNVVIAPMLNPQGEPIEGNLHDAEGLTPLGDGRYAVSFERNHRIWSYRLDADWGNIDTVLPEPLLSPPGADRLRNNAGVEALAANAEFAYAGIEYPLMEGQPHTLWRFEGQSPSDDPRATALNLEPGFGLTGLTMDDAGGLYLIERFYSRDIGNRIRLGYLAPESLANTGPAPLAPELLAEIEPDMSVDNFEAIALAEIDGEPRLFILSDDNFNDHQRTLLLSFAFEP